MNVVSHNGSQEPMPVSARQSPEIPAMPSVPASELYRGMPVLLLESDLRYSVGWQDRRAGPSFVVVRLGGLGPVKVMQRFPLTEQGWASAWHTLSGLDTRAAAAIARKLAEIAAGRRAVEALAALDAESVCCLRRVTFNGGSSALPLVKSQPYDLRFLRDRIMVCPSSSAAAVVDVPFREVESVEVGGPGQVSKSTGEVLALVLGLGFVGAVLGLIFLGLLGLLLGTVLFGLAGALVSAASTKTETIVCIRYRDGEFYFLYTEKRPDALRIELSEPLTAITNARTAQAGRANEPAEPASASVPDQLSKLASLLQQGLISRGEFERLKTQLIAKA